MPKEKVRPPYASSDGVRTLFAKIKTLGPPSGVIDAKWVTAYNVQNAQPQAIVGVLKWLGVVDRLGIVDNDLWKRLRTDQDAALAELVRSSYSEVFAAVEIESAEYETLKGTFINAYGSGDPRKPVAAFLALCDIAGIAHAAQSGPVGNATSTERKVRAPQPAKRVTPASPEARRQRPRGGGSDARSDIVINVQVEIPSEWDGGQVKERLEQVADAIDRFRGRV